MLGDITAIHARLTSTKNAASTLPEMPTLTCSTLQNISVVCGCALGSTVAYAPNLTLGFDGLGDASVHARRGASDVVEEQLGKRVDSQGVHDQEVLRVALSLARLLCLLPDRQVCCGRECFSFSFA